MMKYEFEEMVQTTLTEKEYGIIEKVYMYYPHISDTKGKSQMKYLFDNFGLQVFIDMLPTALKGEEYYTSIQKAKNELNTLQEQYRAFLGVEK